MISSRFFFYCFVALLALVGTSTAEMQTAEVTADGNIQTGSTSGGNKIGDPDCPDRDHLMRCTKEYLDTNKNSKLEREELESAINKLPW